MCKHFSLREKYPNTEFFLVRIFLYSVQIQENSDEKKLFFGHFHAVFCLFVEFIYCRQQLQIYL